MFFLAQNPISQFFFDTYQLHGHWEDPERGKLVQIQSLSSEALYLNTGPETVSKITNSCLTLKTKWSDILSVFGETVWGNMCSMQRLKFHCSRPITDCYFPCVIPDVVPHLLSYNNTQLPQTGIPLRKKHLFFYLCDINISKQQCVFHNKISDLKITKKIIPWYAIFFHNLTEIHEGRTIKKVTQGRNSLSCSALESRVQGPWEKVRVISNRDENRCKSWSAFHMLCGLPCSNRINFNTVATKPFNTFQFINKKLIFLDNWIGTSEYQARLRKHRLLIQLS